MIHNSLQPFLFGGIASCCSELVTFPVDLIKTRLQIQGQLIESVKPKYKGIFNCFNLVVKEEGVKALYGGLKPALLRQGTYGTLKLGIYQFIKKRLSSNPNEQKLIHNIISAIISGASSMAICNPTDVLKIRMQSNPQEYSNKSLTSLFREIFKSEGLKGLYRGTIPNAQRTAVVAAAELATYDSVKQYLIIKFSFQDNFYAHLISSSLSGICAALAATPLDVIKTRMMNQKNFKNKQNADKIYKNSIDCFRKTVKNEGIFALYKGLLTSYLRLGPWTMIFFMTYEKCKLFIPVNEMIKISKI